MNIKYSKIKKERNIDDFRYWDDYALFLFEELCDKDVERYYYLLEDDLKTYSDMQTGKERESRSGKRYKPIDKRKK